VRIAALALAAALLVAGCASSSGSTKDTEPAAAPGTLGAILGLPGPDVALIAGTRDYQPGPERLSFLIVKQNGAAVVRPTARVRIGRSLSSRPLVRATAVLEPIGVPGRSEAALGGATKIYVARFSLARTGTYWVVVQPVGGPPIQGVGNVIVTSKSRAPEVGEPAIPSRTPTSASTHGNFHALTTSRPPDKALLQYSVADSLRAHVPVVVVFATPAFCTCRTCGPVVDVVDAARQRFGRRVVRLIHFEIYKDNDPTHGYNRWVLEWGLPSEPWIFLVGRDGRVKARFEGSVSVTELSAAVRRFLLR
jgi:hypothetical protein